MVYKLEKGPDGEINFYIYNAGDGLEYHDMIPGRDKDKYNPCKAYTFKGMNNYKLILFLEMM